MYNKIEIYNTDFDEKYLLKIEDKTMYVGYLIKEVVTLLKHKKNINQIKKNLFDKHQVILNEEEIETIIVKLNDFIDKKNPVTLIKLFKILDPSKITFPFLSNSIFNKKIFYPVFSIFFIFNLIVFFSNKNQSLKSIPDGIIWTFILMFVLLLHELGHTVSAQKYDVKVRELGFGIYTIFPVFYVDLGESWKLNIEKRIIINFSGIFFQLLLGCCFYGLFILYKTPILINIFHTNFIIIILNLNPFLKFDGYWIVSDLLNEKNLMKKSSNILRDFFTHKIVNQNRYLILYTIFRTIFLIWLIYIISSKIISFIIKIKNNNNINWHDYLPILLLIYFIYRTIKNKMKK